MVSIVNSKWNLIDPIGVMGSHLKNMFPTTFLHFTFTETGQCYDGKLWKLKHHSLFMLGATINHHVCNIRSVYWCNQSLWISPTELNTQLASLHHHPYIGIEILNYVHNLSLTKEYRYKETNLWSRKPVRALNKDFQPQSIAQIPNQYFLMTS